MYNLNPHGFACGFDVSSSSRQKTSSLLSNIIFIIIKNHFKTALISMS